MVVSTIISRLVGRWMQNREKLEVKAVDDYSAQRSSAVRRSGVYHEPRRYARAPAGKDRDAAWWQDQYIPEDKEDLELWAKELQRSPKKSLFERARTIFGSERLAGHYQGKILKDFAEVGMGACEIETVKMARSK
jgi:hypothetical protein